MRQGRILRLISLLKLLLLLHLILVLLRGWRAAVTCEEEAGDFEAGGFLGIVENESSLGDRIHPYCVEIHLEEEKEEQSDVVSEAQDGGEAGSQLSL